MADEEDTGTREGVPPRGVGSTSSSLEDKVRALLANNPTEFSSWTSLVAEIEETSADDIGIISRVYESFLSEFPLCYGYWEKYATHKARLSSMDKVIEVYEEAVRAATYSVDVWANYCSFAMQFYDDLDDVRRLYERGLASVGKDYRCNILWDKCIAFEHSHKQWNRLVHVYIRSLRFPTKKLYSYYKSFKELVALWVEEMKCQNISVEEPLEAAVTCELLEVNTRNDSEIGSLICHLLDQAAGILRPKTLQKILTVAEYFYQKSVKIDDKIHCFEAQIRRPYFHIKPLDDCQLQNWHHYLDFVEMHGDFDWTVKLYERCLIPCTNYPEFWVRYIEIMEERGGREIANLVVARASKTLLRRIPHFYRYCSKVREQVGDIHGARTSFLNCDMDLSSNFIDYVNQQANIEKRLGNIGAAYLIYEKATEAVREQDIQAFSVLYMHFARFSYVVTGDLNAAKGVFVKGISRASNCKALFEGLITFMALHGATRQVGTVDSIVSRAIVPKPGVSLTLSPNDCEDISSLFLEFVDLCGTICEIRKAWARHIKLFPHAMRPSRLFNCSNAIGVFGRMMEKSGVQDNGHEEGIVDSRKQLLFEDAQSSEKNHDLLDGAALTAKSHSEVGSNSMNGNTEQAQLPENAKMIEHETIELPGVTVELLHEAQAFSPNAQGPLGCPEPEHETQLLPYSESHDDLKPSLENLSISHPDEETQQSNPTTPRGDNAIQSPSKENHHKFEGNKVEVAQQPNHDHSKSVMPATAHTPEDNNFKSTLNAQSFQKTEVKTLQNQWPAQAPNHVIYLQNPLNWHQLHYGGQVLEHQSRFHGHLQTQQQQWQVPIQLQHPHSGFSSQGPTAQAYECQPQLWQGSPQMANQLQGQYQTAATQVVPTGAIVWQAPNAQQNLVAGGQSQQVNQMATQNQAFQHPLQSNEYHGYFQDGHSLSSQFWQYYQQQLCHMQQQQGHNSQLQNPQQQLQQNGPHQLQQQQQGHNIQLQLPQQQLQPHQLQQPQQPHQWQQQNQQQMNHLQPQEWQVQQQIHHPQHTQFQHPPQPCQSRKPQESLSQQDLSQLQQDQQYVQHQSWQP